MAFHNWDVEADESFVPEADPALREMKRKAGAAILQDISLHTYWANTMGQTHSPGNYDLLKKELEDNMTGLMRTRMCYRELEEFMVVLGYANTDIRQCFKTMTGVDPVKMEFMRHEDVKSTPMSIPCYSLAWGIPRKKSSGAAYFAQPAAGLFSVYLQVDDMTRREVGTFLSQEEAMTYMKPLVSHLHRYDMPAKEAAEEALEALHDEPTKREYMVMANAFHSQRQRGTFDFVIAKRMIEDSIYSGVLTEAEGQTLYDMHVVAAPSPAQTTDTKPATHEEAPKESPDLDYRQDTADVRDEVERTTPQDFFTSVLPDRMDTITPQHIKDVLTYVSHREKDMAEFDIKLHSLEYMKHESVKTLVETNPDGGRPVGPPRATVSVILEIKDKTLPEDHSRKYALAVFFVNPDGDIGTSDSVKGEDDIIYGFSEDGLRQYFSRDRMVRGEA